MNNKTLKYKEASPAWDFGPLFQLTSSQPLTLGHHPRTLADLSFPNLTVSQPTPLLYPLHPSKSKTPPHNHGSTSRSGTSRRHIYRSALCPSLTDHLPFHPSPRAARSRDRRREREKRNPVLGRKERREEVGKREERINKVGRSLQKEIGEREKSLGDRRPQPPIAAPVRSLVDPLLLRHPEGLALRQERTWILDHAVPLILASTAPLALDTSSSRPHLMSSILFSWTMTPQPRVIKHLMYIPAAAAAAAPTCSKNHQTNNSNVSVDLLREPSPEQLAAAKHPLQQCRSPRHARHPDPPTARLPALLISQRPRYSPRPLPEPRE